MVGQGGIAGGNNAEGGVAAQLDRLTEGLRSDLRRADEGDLSGEGRRRNRDIGCDVDDNGIGALIRFLEIRDYQ